MNALTSSRQKRADLMVVKSLLIIDHLDEVFAPGSRRHHSKIVEAASKSSIMRWPKARDVSVTVQRSIAPNARPQPGKDIFHAQSPRSLLGTDGVRPAGQKQDLEASLGYVTFAVRGNIDRIAE